MAFQLSGFPDDLIREMLEGIIGDEAAFTDLVCGQQFRRQAGLIGAVAVKGSGATLGTIEGWEGLAPAEVAPGEEYNITSVDYHARARVGKGILTDEERNDFDNAFNEEAVNDQLRTARINANTRLDKFLESKLQSTALNTQIAAGSGYGPGWGASSNKMASDLRTAREVGSPGADTIIIGRKLRNVMLDNDALVATPLSGNAYGGGTGNDGALEAWLKQYIGFKHVYFFDKMYDTSGGRGADATVGYFFENNAWVGYSNDLILVHPTGPIQDLPETERATELRSTVVQYTRYDDILRPTKLKGATLTGFQAAS